MSGRNEQRFHVAAGAQHNADYLACVVYRRELTALMSRHYVRAEKM
jgi:hypothetical protein